MRSLLHSVDGLTKQRDALLDTEAQFRGVVEQNIAGIYILTERGDVAYLNERFAQLCGYSAAEVCGRPFLDFVAPVDRTRAMASFEASMRGDSRQLEFTLCGKDGITLDVLAHGARATYQMQPALVGVALDITERRRHEDAEREQNRRERVANDALRAVNRSLRLLIAANHAVVRVADEITLVTEVARLVVSIGGFAAGWIGFAESDEARTVRVVAAAGQHAGIASRLGVTWGEGPLGSGPIGIAIRTGTAQVNRDTVNNPCLQPWRDVLLAPGLRSSVALPLQYQGVTFGALVLYAFEVDAFDDGEVGLLQELADDLAYGIASRRTAVEKEVAGNRLRNVMESAVEVIAATLEARDPYTAGHQRRVAQLASAIARAMGCDEETIRGVHFGALIHDVGKIQIPSELLSKPTKLTALETKLLETHAEAGFSILKGIEFPWPVAQMVLQHHERMNGSGYPHGLTGNEILIESRILAVADVVEAMSSHRPYRPSRGVDVALTEIEAERGTLYDSDAVDACLSLFREQHFTFSW